MLSLRDRRLLKLMGSAIQSALAIDGRDERYAVRRSPSTGLSGDEKILSFIAAVPGGISRSELCKRTYYLGLDRSEGIAKLVESGQVIATEHVTKGRTAIYYSINPNPNPTQGNPDNADSSI